MIGWFRRAFRRPRVTTPRVPSVPNVSKFIERQQGSRADALQVQRESRHTTRMLKQAHPLEAELIARPWKQKGAGDA